MDKTQKEVDISENYKEFKLYYKKISEVTDSHNIEVASIGKDKEGKDILRPVFYAQKDNKCFKLVYNDDGTIKDQQDLSSVQTGLEVVEIFTYKQYKIDANGKVSKDNYPLTADYDQLTAGPVYMTVNVDQDDEKKKKLWQAIDYITGLRNDEFNAENLGQIKSHFKNLEGFLTKEFKEKYLQSDYTILNLSSIDINEIKEQIEYLKDELLVPIKKIDINTIDLEFCISEREKLITYPADKYMKILNKSIENILKIEKIQDLTQIKDDLEKIQEFLPEEFNEKYLQSIGENLNFNSDDIEEIRIQVRIVNKKLVLLGTCSEAITKEKMAIGKKLDYGISHGLEIQHFPPEPIKLRGEEFLIINEIGKVRVIDGLKGLLFYINYNKSRGIGCFEVNPFWSLKKEDNGDIVSSEEEKIPIAGIYSSLVDLQKITKKNNQKTY